MAHARRLRTQKVLTLARARQLFLDPDHGNYVEPTRWSVEDVPRGLTRIAKILGVDFDVQKLKHADYRRAWKGLFPEHLRNSSKASDPRALEMAIGTLATMMRWLAKERYVDPGTGMPEANWKAQLRDDWARYAHRRVVAQEPPLYKPAEVARILQALPNADPRIRIAVRVAGRHRLGQFAQRSTRKDVLTHEGREISRTDILNGAKTIGAVRIHGRGKKLGAIADLSVEESEALMLEMRDGFLANLERAYNDQQIANYRLLQGGYPAGNPPRAQPKNAMVPIGDKALRGYWLELEVLAKVKRQDGRGWLAFSRSVGSGVGEDDVLEVVSDDTILPRPLYENTRGFIEHLAKEVNASFQYKLFNGCAVLMRRLVEVLLILSYENLQIETAIQDSAGHYLPLERIMADAKNNRTLRLSRNSKEILDHFRKLGNFAAHKIHFTTRRADIRNVTQEFRALFEELLYKSAIRK